MKKLIQHFTSERGSTILEFAFISMILLSMTFAMIDFGRYIYASNAVRSAAQEGARVGITPDGDVNAAVTSKLIALDTSKATISPPSLNGNTVYVRVAYEFEFITPFLPSGPIHIEADASSLRFPS